MFCKFTFVLTTIIAFFMFSAVTVSALPMPGTLMGRSYSLNAHAGDLQVRSGAVEARHAAAADIYIPDEPISRRDRFQRRVELHRRQSEDFNSLH